MKLRNGFSMLELIFVIVIIGILAAVAIAKFNLNASDTKINTFKSTIAAINETIFPNMWLDSIKKHKKGSITSYNLNDYTDLPKELSDLNLSKCDDNNNFKIIKSFSIDKSNIDVKCRNGDSTKVPVMKIEVN